MKNKIKIAAGALATGITLATIVAGLWLYGKINRPNVFWKNRVPKPPYSVMESSLENSSFDFAKTKIIRAFNNGIHSGESTINEVYGHNYDSRLDSHDNEYDVEIPLELPKHGVSWLELHLYDDDVIKDVEVFQTDPYNRKEIIRKVKFAMSPDTCIAPNDTSGRDRVLMIKYDSEGIDNSKHSALLLKVTDAKNNKYHSYINLLPSSGHY